MSYDYPPPLLPLWGEIVVCMVLGGCLLAAWYILWRQTAWKASGWRFIAWLVAGWLMGASLFSLSWEPANIVYPLIAATFFAGALAAIVPFSLVTPREKRVTTLLLLIMFAVPFTLAAPSVLGAREAAHRTACKNHLKQLGLAFHNYHETFKSLPQSRMGDPSHSWRIDALFFIDSSPMGVNDFYKLDAAWDQEPNLALASKQIAVYSCPTNSNPIDSSGRWYTAYAMLTGPKTIGQTEKEVTIDDITDGLSNTFFAVEACGANIVWTEPRDIDISERPPGVNLPGDAPSTSRGWLSSCHSGGAHALMADGSVHFISQKIDDQVLRALPTIDGGEKVDDF